MSSTTRNDMEGWEPVSWKRTYPFPSMNDVPVTAYVCVSGKPVDSKGKPGWYSWSVYVGEEAGAIPYESSGIANNMDEVMFWALSALDQFAARQPRTIDLMKLSWAEDREAARKAIMFRGDSLWENGPCSREGCSGTMEIVRDDDYYVHKKRRLRCCDCGHGGLLP